MDKNFFNYIIIGNHIKAWLLFFGIIISCLFLKRLFSRLFSHLLLRFFGRFGKEVNTAVFIGLLIKPVELFLSIWIFYIAIDQLDYPLAEIIIKTKAQSITVSQVVDKVFLFTIAVSTFWIILRIVDFMAHVFTHRATLADSKEEIQIIQFVKDLTKLGAIFIAFFTILGYVFDVNVIPLITGLGIGGIAIALAAKESIENLLGSFTIFVDKPFVIGDFVKVNGIEGTVEKVGFRSTRIRTAEKSLVTMPNKKMVDSSLENMTARDYRRVKFDIGLNYQTPVEKIRKVASDITGYINAHQFTQKDAMVTFENFGESALNLQVLYYIQMMEYNDFLKVKEDINFKIVELVRQKQTEFAFPTQTVIHQNPGAVQNSV